MEITVRGKVISQDEHGYLCLTDMWQLSGEPVWKSPPKWREIYTTKELLAALVVDIRYKDDIKKIRSKSAIYTRLGRSAKTFAHVILALAYGEYLNPKLGIEVREIALRVYAGDVTVLDEFKRAKREQIEEDGNRVMVREEIRRNNYDLNAIVKSVGARFSTQWAAFHNHGYEGLYNGLNENDIHALKKLKSNQAILDHMGFYELAANMYRTALAQQS